MDSELKWIVGAVLFTAIVIVPSCSIDSYYSHQSESAAATACINRGGTWTYKGSADQTCTLPR